VFASFFQLRLTYIDASKAFLVWCLPMSLTFLLVLLGTWPSPYGGPAAAFNHCGRWSSRM